MFYYGEGCAKSHKVCGKLRCIVYVSYHTFLQKTYAYICLLRREQTSFLFFYLFLLRTNYSKAYCLLLIISAKTVLKKHMLIYMLRIADKLSPLHMLCYVNKYPYNLHCNV